MHRRIIRTALRAPLVVAALLSAACTSGKAKAPDQTAASAAIAVAPAAAVAQPIVRFIRASGSLMAEEQADVAAETGGRVVEAPIERGSRVQQGAVLVRISPTEAGAQLKEAEANAAQIEARLGLTSGAQFAVDAVPEVQNAKATYDLASAEFNRIQSLLEQHVVSRSEYDQRRTQMEAARQQLEASKNGAAQQYQALQAARARVALARKAFADTTVRSPFSGVVAERLVSTGDYVTKGMKVAVVVRVNPLRVQITVPEQFISAVGVGEPVAFEVDAYPDKQFEGIVRYVSPSLEAAQRALTIEAIVPNPDGALKPGLFATARIQQPTRTPGILVPRSAVLTSAGTSRVFVIAGGRAEERIVTVGQPAGDLIEITNGLKAGERVATKNLAQVVDGASVQ